MNDRKMELMRKLIDSGVIKDPQWMDRLDEPAPLWVVLDMVMQLIERIDPPHQPFD
ncbi:hypothetical protein Back11_10340 [Paenibacillus baekrokdamisoli]|uniref:Uncharacterized protein n=1 Tax=Paenibacillus baekrokdamisoli TaxID=1712516 RepID=A0A3G9J9P8_9BACL|nr:hypothetical protein [Paenibacillus baekrokdamisoli]MBB3067118.1 hypothetical protein [Paenibacillus baekrokdamisoli]BBH19689.1 hypothetical protein Back11_10340 [Paenibacillus baekrokdamisoli]